MHALVHMREGTQPGEFGSGYSNANYWWVGGWVGGAGRAEGPPRARGRRPAEPRGGAPSSRAPRPPRRYAAAGRHEIQGPLLERARELAAGDAELVKFVANHGGSWAPSRFVALCQQAADGGAPAGAQRFCERVIAAEWRLLFDSCHGRL